MVLRSLLLLPFFVWMCSSCKNSSAWEKSGRELDSIKVVVEQSLSHFKTIDSVACYEAYSKQYTYSKFLNQHLSDTLTLEQAQKLRLFSSLGQGFETWLKNRPNWTGKANASIKQLSGLSHDLKSGAINSEEAVTYISTEKKQAEQIIEELKINTEAIRLYLENYTKTLPVAEEVIKQLHQGVLPEIIKPEISS